MCTLLAEPKAELVAAVEVVAVEVVTAMMAEGGSAAGAECGKHQPRRRNPQLHVDQQRIWLVAPKWLQKTTELGWGKSSCAEESKGQYCPMQ